MNQTSSVAGFGKESKIMLVTIDGGEEMKAKRLLPILNASTSAIPLRIERPVLTHFNHRLDRF